jgi:hypothetical protein
MTVDARPAVVYEPIRTAGTHQWLRILRIQPHELHMVRGHLICAGKLC